MSKRERVIKALRHEDTDTVPYDIRFTAAAYKNMIDYYGDPDFESKLGNCLTIIRPNTYREVRPNIWEDKFGVHWDRTFDKDIGVVANTLVTPENIDSYVFPDPDDPYMYKGFEEKVKGRGDSLAVAKLGYSLFERAWSLASMENILMYMITEKDFVHQLLEKIVEYNLKVIENFVSNDDVDAVYFGDDWGQQTGLIMGPALWREFIGPRIKKMFQAVKAKRKYVFLHCCGNVMDVFPDLIEAGLDVFNPFQPEVIDPAEVKKQYGDRLSFYGGISTQKTLPFGTAEQVKEEVKRLLDVIGNGGGYIASPAHAVPGDAKPENMAAMMDVLQNQ